ncbi:MAG TPA: type II asparaginase [Geminicoccus sp.]|jgi:L-asparaginase|uniref:type II asparaginase n=1 Tax=Geminicoccus sp. TaxID=2024832 RepID=UPI002E37BD47|nr:type II asparaginase [Geminicoccus sp.]HEX2528451.1 type II asparaginase [Geminicoccus sp.]
MPSPTASPAAKPKVHVLATGGTIAGVQADPARHGYTAGASTVETLVEAVPNLQELAAVTAEQVVNIPSQDMDEAVWLTLARRLAAVTARPDTDGIVVTHGTDTLEETAFFVDLTVATFKPIVFTGAMRPATAISADGPLNLFNAVAVAAAPAATGRGTLVVMNDTILSARDAYKLHTSRVETFRAPERGPLGLVDTGCAIFHQPPPATRPPVFELGQRTDLPKVFILHAHAGMTRELIDAACAAGARGLVVAGVGNGNMTAPALAALAGAAAAGLAVVRATRLGEGTVMRNAEVDDDRLGFVVANEFKPGKARALLQLALTTTRDAKAIQAIFDRT